MKKKLLLSFIIGMMLVCLFAIVVFATDIDYSDAPEKTKIQFKADEIIEFYDGFKCPAFYVFKDVSSIGEKDYNTKFESFMDFTYINGKLGKTEEAGNLYTYADVKGFDIPTGITHVAKYAGANGTTLKWITFPDTISSLSNAIFQNATGLEECTLKFSENNTMRVFPSYMFFGCKNLKAFSMPDCFTSLYDVAHFSGCTNLSAVHLSESLVTWSSGGGGSRTATFDDCNNMYFVNETFTYDDIPEKPEVYYFPKNLSSITNNSVCRECKNLNNVLVFGTQLTTMPNQYFFQNGPANKIVFLGDMTTVSTQYWGQTTQIFFANPQDKSTDDVTYSGGRTVVFCNAEGNTQHLHNPRADETTAPTCLDNSVSKTYCFCGADMGSVVNENTALGHDDTDAVVIMYFANNNYFENATSEYTCKRCEEAIKSEIANSALFTKKGITVPENEKTTSICHAITVNNKAIENYNAYLGESNAIKYGVVVGKATASGTPVNTDGTSSGNAIVVGFDGTDYSHIQAKITNVPDENTGLY
ncbi:MAG: leucine-rich repeat protein, partial [Clostridia bacterium]|nr:leucine-rich repeat protein [Clostridia bacterium]